jgi:hypothetical protein
MLPMLAFLRKAFRRTLPLRKNRFRPLRYFRLLSCTNHDVEPSFKYHAQLIFYFNSILVDNFSWHCSLEHAPLPSGLMLGNANMKRFP